MLSSLIRRRWPLPVIVVVVVAAVVVGAVATSGDDGRTLVVYNGRSHYGDEQVFEDFTEATGIEVRLRGGTGPELFERLRSEGDDTPADVLITTDMANLWRAEDAGLLQPSTTATLEANIPEDLHDPDGTWWAISTRLRVPVVNTDAIDPASVTGYEALGDPQYAGRTCLRTSTNEYNQSLVADMIAKRGEAATRALLESWMANDPDIIPTDGEMLQIIADGDCDLGLSNHYYLGRILLDDPDFPVAPAWPDQDGAGAHANVSGLGVVAGTDHYDMAVELLEFMTSAAAEGHVVEGSEFPANPDVPPPAHIADWADVETDPIVADEAGPLLDDAVALMVDVGWP
ncbi:extracellular solute-binding protein [Iamia sp. SCSIO 61187]|uniref:extracellular solute-binding protein n=1 Tax=Iamia sp. SCSIO 61187 TaxID=2722752 RepID=UPI001C63A723|nr:extracellular solute-binding protein [Iamia sp. SCSIO 61187]QYG92010.1 extracellular solute-binding protein [Iamia sp. SCSIO 61187]